MEVTMLYQDDIFKKKLRELAQVVICKGAVVREGQALVLQSAIEAAPFAHEVARAFYENGGSEIYTEWSDEPLDKLRYENEAVDVLSRQQPYAGVAALAYAKNDCCFVKINAPDPGIFSGIANEKLSAGLKAKNAAYDMPTAMRMNGTCRWLSMSVPTRNWAKLVFPELDPAMAYDKLWEIYFDICRVDIGKSVDNWTNHIANLTARANYLTEHKLVRLVYKNGKGTDFTVRLADEHLWVGGTLMSREGVPFVPNIPTEEVASAPHMFGAEGKLVSTKPLCHNGQIIDGFWFEFHEGRVVDFGAEHGYDHLKSIIETDANSCRLGEVALVPVESPISNTNLLFYNTLFDENASCHLALGRGYPVVIKNNKQLSAEQVENRGLNVRSSIHVDFMIGSDDLDVTGYDSNNNTVAIFKNGGWAF